MKYKFRERKPSEAYVKRSVRCRTQHRQVWFAHVVLFALIGSSLSANNIQMTENVASTVLSLQPGKLNFMATLKRPGSTNVGTFVYHEFAAPSTTNVQKLRFFDSEPSAGYVHTYELTVNSPGQMFRGIFSPSVQVFYYNMSLTGNSANFVQYIVSAYNTETSAFVVSSFSNGSITANGRYVPLKSDDVASRGAIVDSNIRFFSYNPSHTVQATKTISAAESSNFEYIDQVSKIGNYALYIHRSGLLVWDDETVENNSVNTQTQLVANFQPKFAVKDSSRVCTDANCDIIVFQERNSNVYHLSMLNVKITSAPTVGTLKFTSLDVTSVATLNFPITVPSLQFVALTGSDRFYLYRIYDDRFEADAGFDSVTFTGMQPGSLEVGDFNTAIYPYQRPVMAMFAEGGVYKAKMFVLKVPGCAIPECTGCNASGICTSCNVGAVNYLETCTICGNMAPAAIFVNSGTPTCVDTSSGTYATGHGRDTTITDFVLVKPCSVVGCNLCSANFETCTQCTNGKVLHLNQCTTCSTTAPAAIFVNSGTPTCVDTSSGTYATGHGRDTTITDFVLVKPCSVVGCNLCSANFETCTQCTNGKVLHLNQCTTCSTTAPAAIFVNSGTPTCVDTSSGTYATGHGRDTTITDFVLVKPCSVIGCNLCSANFETCTECTAGRLLDLNKCFTPPSTNPAPNNPTPPPSDPNTSSNNTGFIPTQSNIPDPEVAANKLFTYASVVTKSPSVNGLALTFRPGQSLNIDSVFVVDLDSSKVYTCAETNCRFTWKNRFLRVSFKPSFTIRKGLVIIRRKQIRTSIVTETQNSDSDRDRLLQTDTEDFSDVVIPGLTLTRTTGYTEWMTTGQVMLFALRTVGSVVVFPKYPRLAMIPDLLITISLMVCMLLGPVMYSASIALTSLSQVKIPWYYFGSVVEDWDTETLSLPTSPNTWNHPVFTSFLDNYSQNTVGLCALAVVLAVVWFIARRVTQNKQSSPRTLRIATSITMHYGKKFWFAKVHANSLEMMMYSLISFDKADASSKSVIGIVLAVLFVGFQVWLAMGAAVLSVTRVDTVTPPQTTEQIEIIDQSQLGTTSPGSVPEPTSIKQKALRVLVAGWQFMPTSTLQQVPRSKSFTDTAFFLRNLGLCVIALKLIASAQAQLIVATCLQSLYLTYFVYCNAHRERIEHYSTLSVEAVALAIMLVKTVSTASSISESVLQNTLGTLILVCLAIVVVAVFGSFGLALVWTWKSEQKTTSQPDNFVPCTTVATKQNTVQPVCEKDAHSSNLPRNQSHKRILSHEHREIDNEEEVPPQIALEKDAFKSAEDWDIPVEAPNI